MRDGHVVDVSLSILPYLAKRRSTYMQRKSLFSNMLLLLLRQWASIASFMK